MNKLIENHFKRADPILFAAAKSLGEMPSHSVRSARLYFADLAETIISQQLSGRAASTIFGRFKRLCGRITPENVLKLRDEDMRNCGLSNAKVQYTKDLAKHIKDKKINLAKISLLPNEEIINKLVQVKGIGRWTAEMFLMFTLGREDVFSHGDLGLRNAIKKLYQLDNPTTKEIENIVQKWSPYRTWASRILWKSLDTK